MQRLLSRIGIACLLTACALSLMPFAPSSASKGGTKGYSQHDLVSDLPELAPFTDSNLVNPWGVAAGDDTALWVADNGRGVSTIYRGNGRPASLLVTIPPPSGSEATSQPTGIVYSEVAEEDETAFAVTGAGGTGPSVFIFDTLDGTISGWSPVADLTHAILEVDNSAAEAVYTGLAIIEDHIFAANFAAGVVEIYDKDWQLTDTFTGPNIPDDPSYSPFGIQAIGDELYVAYAVRGDEGDEEPGPGLGIVDVFDEEGNFIREFAAGEPLNAPWGITLAPANFGAFSGAVLIGNFGDGRIDAFEESSGTFLGALSDRRGETIEIEGLWGIIFGNGDRSGKSNRLYFAAGIDDEAHGLLGWLGTRSDVPR